MAADLSRHVLVNLFAAGRLAIWLVVFAAIFVPIERLFALHPQKVLRTEIAVDLQAG